MSLESVAILFVFVGNAAAIILLAFMLFRILSQTEATHDLMRQGSSDLIDAAKRLREMLAAVDRLSDRLIDANKLAVQAAQPLSLTEDSLEKIAALTDSLTRESIEEHEQIVGDMRELLVSLHDTPGEHLSTWRQQHEDKLGQAVTQRSQLATELEQVKLRLDEAHVVIAELRRANRLAEASTQSADVLRQNLEQQQVLLNRAKERAQKAEASANALTQEVEKLQTEVDRARHTAEKDMEDLRAQMGVMAEERTVLFNQLEELKSTMQRTLREKEFIEDKLLDLDEAHRAVQPAAPATSTAGEPEPTASGSAIATEPTSG
jgi:chromosome segregation ATPase